MSLFLIYCSCPCHSRKTKKTSFSKYIFFSNSYWTLVFFIPALEGLIINSITVSDNMILYKSPKAWPVLPRVVILWVFLQDFSGELQFLWWISQPFHNHFTMVPGRREKISVEINLHIHHICLLHNHQCFLRIKIHEFHVLLLFMKVRPHINPVKKKWTILKLYI